VGDLLLKLVSFRPIDVVYITDSILTLLGQLGACLGAVRLQLHDFGEASS